MLPADYCRPTDEWGFDGVHFRREYIDAWGCRQVAWVRLDSME